MTTSLLGRPVAQKILDESRRRVDRGRSEGRPVPGLTSVHRATTGPFALYLRQQGKTAERAGVEFRDRALGPSDTTAELIGLLEGLDADPAVHAVLLEHPLPPTLDFFTAVSRLSPVKDVDGVGAQNL